MESALNPILEEAVDAGGLPGVAAIALDASGSVLYKSAFGRTSISDTESPKVTTSTPLNIYSCTKLFTTVAALQLLETGKLDLHAPAGKYCPEIDSIQVLDGFNDDGSPRLHPPKNKITVLHLFTHTAGFSYDFFEPDMLKCRLARGDTPAACMGADTREYYLAPLLHEPGAAYTYGIGTDWLGFVVEAVTGSTLVEYVDEHILKPLSLKNTGLTLTPERTTELFRLHLKDESGQLALGPPLRDPTVPLTLAGGGDYLYSTVEDLSQFLLTLLNKGTHPTSGATLLKPETVQKYLFTDMLPEVGCGNNNVGRIMSSMPPISSTGTFLPGVEKGWSLGLLVNNEPMPNGRSKGSGAWAGLGNLYYWMDPVAGKLGLVASSYFPFFDKSTLHLVDALERAVYGKAMAGGAGGEGSNFKCGLS
ncbi:hypothetical protein LTR53_016981 [Teratosphaeriaceae sp. CCFEE 6253]|nr:hypothetical protein LTR53_016981 [Teratosphaeriaceae sp. CCFEE 6253]